MKIENPKDQYEMTECREILADRFPKIGNTLKFENFDGCEVIATVISVDLEYENVKVNAFVAGLIVLEFPGKMIESFMLSVEDEWYGTNHDEYGMDLYLLNRDQFVIAYEFVR